MLESLDSLTSLLSQLARLIQVLVYLVLGHKLQMSWSLGRVRLPRPCMAEAS